MNNFRLISYGAALLGAVYPLLSQEQVAALSINDHRPLARAAEYLEQKLGIPINYEDPEYTFAGDLEDVTERVSNPAFRAAHPDHRVLAPRRSEIKLSIPFDIDPRTGRATNPHAVLSAVILAHRASGGAGEFATISGGNGDGLSIVGVRARGKDGSPQPHAAAMEQPISIPRGKRTGTAILDILCRQLGARIGHPVVIGTIPTNLLLNQTADLSDLSGPAMDVLSRVLANLRWTDPSLYAPRPKLAWSLLYDPGMNAHFLNLRIVLVDAPTPIGGMAPQPLVY